METDDHDSFPMDVPPSFLCKRTPRSPCLAPHFCPDLDATPTWKLILIPQPLQVHAQMRSGISYPHSSALNLTPMKNSNSRNAQCVFMLSKWLQCGTGRYYLLLRRRNPLSLIVLLHRVQNLRIFTTRLTVGSSRAFSLLRVTSTPRCQCTIDTAAWSIARSGPDSSVVTADSACRPLDAMPTASNIHATAPVAATAQPRLLPLRTRFVLFLCCASPPHADGH
ncbi:hypothetical protein BDR05DRAFT_559059 [Suillus weaverae]|nr:hypothetical protein BDR05DRAFT_559059 [Suillus weaverae]